MFDTIWLILLLPILGALGCAFNSQELGRRGTGLLASFSILGAFLVSSRHLLDSLTARDSVFWNWLSLPVEKAPGGMLDIPFGACVDGLSLTMLTMITGVAFLIHLYATEYMKEEVDYGRFFASLNLFVATMVCLVLADNLAMLLIGWGGVGYASYSLIGFYTYKPSAVSAARKAFMINVLGDVGLMLAIFLVASDAGSLRYADILSGTGLESLKGHAYLIGACLLLAAYAKSAQLPLHTWLPDAMEGPTPVSALIHAATMVTAGVYLLVRCHAIFELSPDLMNFIAWMGAITALAAALSALVQTDLKRILAYSTMSQLGYMFMAAGAGAYGPAIFHLVAHAFFKALLFLSAGAVIHALHGEQDIRKMGGLWKSLSVTHVTFLIGALALAGLAPLVGFYSKEAILTGVMTSTHHSSPEILWGIGIFTALLTAYYTGRAYLLTFHGPAQHDDKHLHLPGGSMEFPLIVLALLTVVAGMAHLGTNINAAVQYSVVEGHDETMLVAVAVVACLAGLATAFGLHRNGKDVNWPQGLRSMLEGGFGFDSAYSILFVQPARRFCNTLAGVIDDIFSRGVPNFLGKSGVQLSQTLGTMQSGNLRMYALAVSAGVAIFILFSFICMSQVTPAVGGH